jgi:hypothetical protein
MADFNFAAFANSIGNFYQLIDQEMGNFLQNNITELDAIPRQLDDFTDKQSTIQAYANTFFHLSDKIAFDGAAESFKKISETTASLNDDIRKIEKVDKWINFSAGVISLGLAIITKNNSGIISSLQSIKNAITSKPPRNAEAS